MLNPKMLEAMRVLEERILNSLLAERHGRIEDPNYAAANEHADEGIALAARDLVDAIDAANPEEWPVGWFCGEVQMLPDRGVNHPVFGKQCRLRPQHDGGHDWARDTRTYLIWSNHHKAWFAPKGAGYVANLADAGVFTLADTKNWLGRGCYCCQVPEVVVAGDAVNQLDSTATAKVIAEATQAVIDAGKSNMHYTKAVAR